MISQRELTWTDRMEKLLALILIYQQPFASDEKNALKLSLAGFSNMEIANLLEIKALTVARLIHTPKKKAKKVRKHGNKSRR